MIFSFTIPVVRVVVGADPYRVCAMPEKLGFIGELTATQKPRPPCVKGAPDEDGWGIVFPYATIPPSRLRRATSLYTREAYARRFATSNPPPNQNLKPLRRTVEDAGPYGLG